MPVWRGGWCSGLDGGVLLLAAGDFDLAGLGLLGDGDNQAEYAVVVVGFDVVEVEVVAEDELAVERAADSFGGEHLPVAVAAYPFGLDGEHVAFDVQVDAFGAHPGEVELDDEPVTFTPGVHGHDRRSVGGTPGR